MIIKWVGSTRKLLASEKCASQVEFILRRLSDFVGDKLVVDENCGEAQCLNLTEDNGLIRCVNGELMRSQRSIEQFRSLGVHDVPHHRSLGSVHFKTQDGTKNVHLRFDEYGLAPVSDELRFGNTLSIESDETNASGKGLAKLALTVMETVFDNDVFDHGYCCLSNQYDDNNIDRSSGGMRAVGLDASRWLPGFYWANYFGAYLCDFIGREKLRTVPEYYSTQLGSGVLVVNRLPPDRWSDSEFIENAHSAISHIGRHLFFERGSMATGRLFTQET